MKAAAAHEGFAWWPELAALLAEFDGLTIQWQDPVFGSSKIILDAVSVMSRYWPEDLEEYRLMFRTELTPIGAHGPFAILAGRDGRVFGAFEDSTACLGRSVREALVNLIDETFRRVS